LPSTETVVEILPLCTATCLVETIVLFVAVVVVEAVQPADDISSIPASRMGAIFLNILYIFILNYASRCFLQLKKVIKKLLRFYSGRSFVAATNY